MGERDASYYKALSKTLAHALRHAPWIYELELDEAGWTDVTAVLEALGSRRRWSDVGLADVAYVIEHQNKERYQLQGEKIRALYGHSLQAKILKEPARPPEVLFHGTSPEAAELILTHGLKPMRRQYVHLSVDRETAVDVGKRKAEQPVLLYVETGAAVEAGISFYRGNDLVWLADVVPAAYIFRL